MDERLSALGCSVMDVAEGCCCDCEVYWCLRDFDGECYKMCEGFEKEVKELEAAR